MLGGRRRLPVGAEPSPKIGRGVHFRVWAPHAETLEVVVEGGEATGLEREPDGYFSGVVDAAGPGTRYRYRLDHRAAYADPASRYQPEGVHGPSEVVDSTGFAWTDAGWTGVTPANRVVRDHGRRTRGAPRICRLRRSLKGVAFCVPCALFASRLRRPGGGARQSARFAGVRFVRG